MLTTARSVIAVATATSRTVNVGFPGRSPSIAMCWRSPTFQRAARGRAARSAPAALMAGRASQRRWRSARAPPLRRLRSSPPRAPPCRPAARTEACVRPRARPVALTSRSWSRSRRIERARSVSPTPAAIERTVDSGCCVMSQDDGVIRQEAPRRAWRVCVSPLRVATSPARTPRTWRPLAPWPLARLLRDVRMPVAAHINEARRDLPTRMSRRTAGRHRS